MATRFACLLVQNLPTQIERLHNPALVGRPTVVLRDWDGHVLDASAEAASAGIGPGDSGRRVEQLCPQATIIPARQPVYQSHHDAIRNLLHDFADGVETCALGEFIVDVTGLARTFSSEKALGLHAVTRVERDTRLQAMLGIAGNKFTAAQAARAALNERGRVVTVPDGHERRFLEPLPVTALPGAPSELIRRLHLFGITTLGGFALLPHAAVTLQFGPEGGVFHDLARGADPRPLVPDAPPPSVVRTLTLPEPLDDRTLLLAALERLAGRVAHALNKSGWHTTALTLIVVTRDGQEHMAGAAVKPPSADSQLLKRLCARLFDALSLTAEVTRFILVAYPLREWHAGARQLTLFDAPVKARHGRLLKTLRLLQQRFGEFVLRLASAIGPPVPVPIRVTTHVDGSPAELQWGGWARRVSGTYEFWREQTRWDNPSIRDYFLIECRDGLTFTVFRDGQGDWYLDRRRR